MVADGDRLAVGGHHFARLPLQLVRTVAAQTAQDLRYFAWAGGLPLEVLLGAGKIAEIDLCFSSLDIFGLAPRFRTAAETGTLPVRDWPALAMIQSLRAAQQNLPFMPMQLPDGSDIMARCPAMRRHRDERSGREVALVDATVLDVLLLHAPRADTLGNVELVGAQALDLLLVGAARKVLVTVEEIVPAGVLARSGGNAVILRNRVSAIAEVPGGAYPASCLPHYPTDYQRMHRLLRGDFGSSSEALAMPEQGVPRELRLAARLPVEHMEVEPFLAPGDVDGPATIDEILAVRISHMLDNNSFASAGAVSPLANVAYRLAKASHAPDLLISTFSSGHLDIDPGFVTLSMIESQDAQTAVAHSSGDATYSDFYQGGYVTHERDRPPRLRAESRSARLPNHGTMSGSRELCCRRRAGREAVAASPCWRARSPMGSGTGTCCRQDRCRSA